METCSGQDHRHYQRKSVITTETSCSQDVPSANWIDLFVATCSFCQVVFIFVNNFMEIYFSIFGTVCHLFDHFFLKERSKLRKMKSFDVSFALHTREKLLGNV